MHSAAINFLKSLRITQPIDDVGICSNLCEFLHKEFKLSISDAMKHPSYELMTLLIEIWCKHNSLEYGFPCEGSKKDYWQNSNLWDANTKFGKNRYIFLDFLIQTMTVKNEQEKEVAAIRNRDRAKLAESLNLFGKQITL